jgi:hypothetical protein
MSWNLGSCGLAEEFTEESRRKQRLIRTPLKGERMRAAV